MAGRSQAGRPAGGGPVSRSFLDGKTVKVRGIAICAHPFDAMLCVAPPGHSGDHVTSSSQFPQGVKKQAIYADLADLSEDERVAVMGREAESGKTIAFVVENEEKADRYIRKLLLDFKVRVIDRGKGPVKGLTYVKVGPE